MTDNAKLDLNKNIIDYVVDYYEFNSRPVQLSILSRKFLKSIRKIKNDNSYNVIKYIKDIDPLMVTMRKDGTYLICHIVTYQYVVHTEGLTIPMNERPFELQHYKMAGPSEKFIYGEFDGPPFTDSARTRVKEMNEEYFAKIKAQQ